MTYYLIALALIGLCFTVLMHTWQKQHPKFDLADLVTGDNERVSLSKLGQITALGVSTWGFIVLTEQGKLTETYFGIYMSVWTGAKILQSGIDKLQLSAATKHTP